MRVRLTTDRAGTAFVQYEGEEVDLPEGEARALLRAGQAEVIEEARGTVPPQPEPAPSVTRPRKR